MPRLGQTPPNPHQFLEIPSMPWLNEALGGGFLPGGIYAVAGEPGVGKSTLCVQAIGNLALKEVRVLYLTNEQSIQEIGQVTHRLFALAGGDLPEAIQRNFFVDDSVREVDSLSDFLVRKVLPASQEYHGVRAIVFDSVQGRGMSANATDKWRGLYDFTKIAKEHALVTILLAHVNKAGQMAGPKTFEHNLDVLISLRRAYGLRPAFVPKNRFGQAVLDPISLYMTDRGALDESPQATSETACVYGYAGGMLQLAEAQASVSLPKYGSRAKLNAPNLPRPKMEQLRKVLSTLQHVDLSDLSYEVNAYIPGRHGYAVEMDLPLAIAMLSSFLHLPVPDNCVFVGELDLAGRVRPASGHTMERLSKIVISGKFPIDRVIMSDKTSDDFRRMALGPDADKRHDTVIGVRDLENALRLIWPSLFGQK